MKVRICFHDKCFDGASSAAIFSRFYHERINPEAEFLYTGMTHKASAPFEDGTFDGDENAIVDFKYSSSPLLTWWFDHHQSAFLKPEDAEHFKHDHSGKKFYDPTYKSCTKLLADIASSKFGFDAKPLADLIKWGDIIDGAQFASAEEAVGLKEPAMQLALVIEAAPEPYLVPRIIPDLSELSLAEMVQLPLVKKHLGPLLERHKRSIDIMRERADFRGRRDLFRRQRSRPRGLQQVRAVFSVSRRAFIPWASARRLRARKSPWARIHGKTFHRTSIWRRFAKDTAAADMPASPLSRWAREIWFAHAK